jgi:hypothetical protein
MQEGCINQNYLYSKIKDMIYFGNNITRNEPLRKTDFNEINTLLTDKAIASLVARLRRLKKIDTKGYQQQKKILPFVIGAKFTHDTRKSENLEAIYSFILDIDHIGTRDELQGIKQKLMGDTRVELMFESPGEDGLKVFMKLASPIENAKTYSDFYKSFSSRFAQQYNLEKYLDFKTHDATRVCFISNDNAAYYNPEPELVPWQKFIQSADLFKQAETLSKQQQKETVKGNDPEPDVYKEILKKLNPKSARPKKDVFVPPILNGITGPIESALKEYNFDLKKINDIQFGKKLNIGYKNQLAEINVFFGKRGFSVVKVNKRGTNPELAEVSKRIVEHVLFEKITSKSLIPTYEEKRNNLSGENTEDLSGGPFKLRAVND